MRCVQSAVLMPLQSGRKAGAHLRKAALRGPLNRSRAGDQTQVGRKGAPPLIKRTLLIGPFLGLLCRTSGNLFAVASRTSLHWKVLSWFPTLPWIKRSRRQPRKKGSRQLWSPPPLRSFGALYFFLMSKSIAASCAPSRRCVCYCFFLNLSFLPARALWLS